MFNTKKNKKLQGTSMAEFIEHEAMDNLEEQEEEDEEDNQDSNFIDDNTIFEDQIAYNYRLVKDSVFNFEESSYATAINVTIGLEEAMALVHYEDYEYEGEISNFVLAMILFQKQ